MLRRLSKFRGLLSPENGQPGFTALQPTRLPGDARPAVACFDVTIGDDHKNDEGKIVIDRVRREEARIVADLVSGLIGTYQVWDKRLKTMRSLFPRAKGDGLYALADPAAVLESLAGFVNAAQRYTKAGDVLPGAGAEDDNNDLAFALPGGAKESYFELKSSLIAERLADLSPLWGRE